MGQYDRHVFVCTSGETCPRQGDTDTYVKLLRAGVQKANRQGDVRVNKAGCFSQCGHGPMIVVYPENVWYAGVQESDLDEILGSHIIGGYPVERLRYDPGVKGPNKIEVEAPSTPAASATGPAWQRACRAADVPASEMGATAVQFLVERIAHPDAPPMQELFAPPISLRSSTGPAPAPLR